MNLRNFSLKRLFASAMAIWASVVMVFAPVAVYAQGVESMVPKPPVPTPFQISDPGRAVSSTIVFILNQILQALVIALLNAAQVFLGQLAYDAATAIATSGQGQEAVFFKEGFGKYLEGVAADALGEAIGSISQDVFGQNNITFDLCAPSIPNFNLNMQLALPQMFSQTFNLPESTRPRPRCELKTIVQNWNTVIATMSRGDVFKNVTFNTNAQTTDLGMFNTLVGRYLEEGQRRAQAALQDRMEGDGFKAVKGIISGDVKTPSQLVREETRSQIVDSPKQGQWSVTEAVFTNAFNIGIPQLFTYTASVFANTLATKLMKRLFERGISPGNELRVSPEGVAQTNREDTRRAFIDLKTPNLATSRDFDAIAEMMGCPPQGRGSWNCVMDQGLGRALQTKTESGGGFTIKQAMAENLLHANWKLIPDSEVRDNLDPNCYQRAYCVGNLRKMRLLRLLPVGFEFAANSPENQARCRTPDGCVTLGEVVNDFFKCNAEGKRDEANPWCKLVDPTWVLSAIPQQCALNGYGDTLLGEAIGQRREECQDVQTCLKRNDKGECVGGYGYCLADRIAYRFGADECPAREASCRVYTSRSGQDANFLRNTIDYGRCSADNVGCMWYSTQRNPLAGALENWIGTTTTGEKMYFDKTLESCPSDQEGCTRLKVATVGDSSVNFIQNPSFELTDSARTTNNLIGWTSDSPVFRYAAPTSDDGETANDGAQSYPATATFLSQRVSMERARSYTLSYYARKLSLFDTAASVSMEVLQQANPVGGPIAAVPASEVASSFITRSTCSVAPGTPRIVLAPASGINLDTQWLRFECSFVAASSTKSAIVSISGNNTMVDAVQLEESEGATAFVNGLNQSLPEVHMKIAPDEFNCSGSDTDHPLCTKFAKVCRQSEAGCNAYTDSLTGGSAIPAILSANDLCPQECVGYAEFRKQPTAFDLVVDTDSRLSDPTDASSSHFIPSTAQMCQQSDVGCEAFTNLEAQVTGGEAQAYFSYVRACELPDTADTQTYYTWEGSDTTGYQLRTWSLKKTTREKPGEPGPEVLALADRFAAPPGPRILLKRAPGQSFIKEPASCNESTIRGAGGQAVDPDCRQFYDASGNIFYRYYSQTVLSTDSCVRYRANNSNQNDCQKTGGEFDPANNECVYRVFSSESLACTAAAAGCRAYAGTGAGNEQSLITKDFRDGQIAPFVATNGRVSDEALLVGDKSLRLDNTASPGAALSATVSVNSEPAGLYRVSFYAKAPVGQPIVRLITRSGTGGAGSPVTVGQVTLTPEWQRFSVGLFNGYAGASSTGLTLSVEGSGNIIAFLDEIVVTRVQDVVYAKRDSWSTPEICDRSFSGVLQPQAMLGCREYKTRNNATVNARQFSRLCREQAIGCMAFVDTRNSVETEAKSFVMSDPTPIAGFGPVTTTRAADRMLYLIDDPSKRCSSQNASCRAFGKPVLSADRNSVERYETRYFKDDITKYGDALCRQSETFCEEFSGPGGSKEYFKDPQNHICEYRTDVTVGSIRYDGYFIKGTDTPCYPNYLQDGRVFGLRRRGDADYAGWVGLCSPENGECTEFRDPSDTSEGGTLGRGYYFVKNDKIDTRSCAGGVDLSNGCVLLQDMSDLSKKYSSKATYDKYAVDGFRATSPIDCSNASASGCQLNTNYCVGTLLIEEAGSPARSENVENYDNGTCSTDADCNDIRFTPGGARLTYTGVCAPARAKNDTNIVVKVNVDRDCSKWLGCTSSETVLDPSTNRYRDICSSLAVCDRSTGNGNDIFCANYINRDTASTEPILTKGAFFDVNQYVSREIGLGKPDYSGFTIPNAFQVADMVNTRVAVDGLPNDRNIQSKYSLEYRLAAKIAITTSNSSNTAAISQPGRFNEIAARYPNLRLCFHVGTSRIGYRGNDGYCYLPVTSDVTDAYDFQNLAQRYASDGANPATDSFLLRAFPPAECRAQPEQDAPFSANEVLSWNQGKNPPAPTAKAPGLQNANTCEFGEDCSCTYKRVEFGQGVYTKFYSPYSSQVISGVCQGGPRDGEACIPGNNPNAVPSANSNPNDPASLLNCGPMESGGRCLPLTKSTLISGVFGQCLERDTTRTVGRDIQSNPCLVWNPTPVLFGEKDRYHYTPTAAYLPPENAGQYYCTSLARPSTSFVLNQDYFARITTTTFRFAGDMNKMYFDDHCLSQDSNCRLVNDADRNFDSNRLETVDGYASAMITSGRSSEAHKGTHYAAMCEKADDIQDGDGGEARLREVDFDTLRLVGTGRTEDSSYVETFFRVNPVIMGAKMNNVAVTRAASGDVFTTWGGGELYTARAISASEQYFATQESRISYFSLQPIQPKTEYGRLGCGYQADWVENLGEVNYEDKDSLKEKDAEWRRKFLEKWNPILGRGAEKYFGLGDGEGNLFRVPCIWNDPEEKQYYPPVSDSGAIISGGQDSDRKCYVKYWEQNYQADGQRAFTGLNTEDGLQYNGSSFASLQANPITRSCSSDRPYFGIRAVFQTSAVNVDAARASKDSVGGPWRFIGFWTTSCGGKLSNDYRHIYFKVELKNASICKEVAETKSVNTRQDAAFTDRIWRESGYIVPGTGISYGVRNSPFSSALNTKPISKDPLFQSGSEVAAYGGGKVNTFIAAGADTYFRDVVYPRDKWAFLTNIFARVYRVYKYYDQPVLQGDRACVSGPAFGTRCTNTPPTAEYIVTRQRTGVGGATRGYVRINEAGYQACSVHGVCDPALASSADLEDKGVCNALSGINAGLTCGLNLDDETVRQLGVPADRAKNDICHLGPLGMSSSDGLFKPIFADCVSEAGLPAGVGRCTDESARGLNGSFLGTAVDGSDYKLTFRNGKFCPLPVIDSSLPVASSTRYGNGPSVGCPVQVKASCITDPGPNRGKCNANQMPGRVARAYNASTEFYGSCEHNADCSFTSDNYYLTEHDALGQWHAGLPIFSRRSVAVTDNSVRLSFEDFSGSYEVFAASEQVTNARNNLNVCTSERRTIQIARGDDPAVETPDPFDREQCVGLVHAQTRNFIPDGSAIGRIGAYAQDPLMSGNPNTREYRRAPSATYLIGPRNVDVLGLVFGTLFLGPFNPALQDVLNNIGNDEVYVKLAQCERLKDLYSGRYTIGTVGRCRGGLYDGRLCLNPAPGRGRFSCIVEEEIIRNGGVQETGQERCQPVDSAAECRGPSGPNPDTDQNICTHGVGYYPNPRICPNPDDEYCGLISYTRSSGDTSLDPRNQAPLPTDVTLGHYTPAFLGFRGLAAGNFSYVGYYTPSPPRIAAPDTRSCPTPGQCTIQKMDTFSLNGLSEGVQSIPGGQYKALMRFYGWAAHNQMAMRKLVIDWGDSQKQELNDVKMKNKKPFCGVQKECWLQDQGHSGLTCEADTDCPAGSGTCMPIGYCDAEPHKTCALNTDCDRVEGSRVIAGRCVARNFFGNSPEACETNYFEFAHQYTCNGRGSLPLCQTAAGAEILRCSRDPNRTCTTAANCAPGDQCLPNLAPTTGCWDATANSCRFTPRLHIQDNWGWCTGECRAQPGAGTQPLDAPSSNVIHRYGGCYSGTILGQEASAPKVKSNTLNGAPVMTASECNTQALSNSTIRPWIVYPGSIQLRSR